MKDNQNESVKRTLLNRLMSGDAKESSKRALAIYVVIVLGTLITSVALYKEVDYIFLLMTWLGFAATLLGMSEYNKNRTKNYESKLEIEKYKAEAAIVEKVVVDEDEINTDETTID